MPVPGSSWLTNTEPLVSRSPIVDGHGTRQPIRLRLHLPPFSSLSTHLRHLPSFGCRESVCGPRVPLPHPLPESGHTLSPTHTLQIQITRHRDHCWHRVQHRQRSTPWCIPQLSGRALLSRGSLPTTSFLVRSTYVGSRIRR